MENKRDEKKLFTDRRWTDIPKATVIGHIEITPEEKEETKRFQKVLTEFREKGEPFTLQDVDKRLKELYG